MAFSWLLGQPVKDTLCGTKVLWKKDYELIAANRSYFGDFDPFGDFDLIFGAAKLNLKIIDLPIRYRERTYGTTSISRWKHGLLLWSHLRRGGSSSFKTQCHPEGAFAATEGSLIHSRKYRDPSQSSSWKGSG